MFPPHPALGSDLAAAFLTSSCMRETHLVGASPDTAVYDALTQGLAVLYLCVSMYVCSSRLMQYVEPVSCDGHDHKQGEFSPCVLNDLWASFTPCGADRVHYKLTTSERVKQVHSAAD